MVDAGLLLLWLGLSLLARNVGGFAEWYATHIYPIFVQTLGRIWGVFPFSVFECFCVGLVAYLIAEIAFTVHRFRKAREYVPRVRITARACARVLTVALSTLLLYTLTCGINYSRTPFSAQSGLTVRKTDVATLTRLCDIITTDLCAAADGLEADANGCSTLPENAKQTAVDAMNALGEAYAALDGFYPKPKALLSSVWFSYQNVTGIYSPFTVEANYNKDPVAYNIPFTMCHELSHLRGFMREDEANFIAYLACQQSEDIAFRYSGAMLAYIYATNALYNAADAEALHAFDARLPEIAHNDLTANSAFWDRYKTKIAEISDKLNDAYLKANQQTDGVQSYGRMVDLLIAYRIPEA